MASILNKSLKEWTKYEIIISVHCAVRISLCSNIKSIDYSLTKKKELWREKRKNLLNSKCISFLMIGWHDTFNVTGITSRVIIPKENTPIHCQFSERNLFPRRGSQRTLLLLEKIWSVWFQWGWKHICEYSAENLSCGKRLGTLQSTYQLKYMEKQCFSAGRNSISSICHCSFPKLEVACVTFKSADPFCCCWLVLLETLHGVGGCDHYHLL